MANQLSEDDLLQALLDASADDDLSPLEYQAAIEMVVSDIAALYHMSVDEVKLALSVAIDRMLEKCRG